MAIYFFAALRPDFGSWPPIAVLRDHTHWTHNTVGLLWTRDQLDAETYENRRSSQKTNTRAPGWIRTHNPSMRETAQPRLRYYEICDVI